MIWILTAPICVLICAGVYLEFNAYVQSQAIRRLAGRVKALEEWQALEQAPKPRIDWDEAEKCYVAQNYDGADSIAKFTDMLELQKYVMEDRS